MTELKTKNYIPIALTELTCGFAAGTISKTIVAPLERIKLILQNQQLIRIPDKLKYKGTFDALRSTQHSCSKITDCRDLY